VEGIVVATPAIISRRPHLAVVCLTLLLLCGGCASKPKARRPKPPKPWIGIRSLIIFPMAPATTHAEPQAVADAMTAGWKKRLLSVPEGAELVQVRGAAHGNAIETMSINLSNVRVEADSKKQKLKPRGAPLRTLSVQNFEFVAQPLLVERSRFLINMTATDATLDVRRDKQGRSMVTLTNARDGALTLEVPKKDIDTLMLDVGRKMAGPYGVSIDKTKLKLDIAGRTIKADLKVDTRLGFLPAGLRFNARVDIDDQLNGRITRLSCSGDQLLGPIISSIIDPALQKYEGKVKPLVGFEMGEMALKDMTLESGDAFKIDVKFGTGAKPRAMPAPQRVASK
jgi:hypothetical protein